MAKFHFVEDYERHVDGLIEKYPIDEAMSRAVGGDFERVGGMLLNMLNHAGLTGDMSVFDLGCGSGRLASALDKSGTSIQYTGTDVVQKLLDYAADRAPAHYRFINHPQLSLPVEDESIDIACAFSVFTHLLHHETYAYLRDMRRALKTGGKAVFSFLEFGDPGHWNVFQNLVGQLDRYGEVKHIDMFIERSVIERWSEDLGFSASFVNGGDRPNGADPLGQSVAILRKL